MLNQETIEYLRENTVIAYNMLELAKAGVKSISMESLCKRIPMEVFVKEHKGHHKLTKIGIIDLRINGICLRYKGEDIYDVDKILSLLPKYRLMDHEDDEDDLEEDQY